ncbi:MAG TPA: tryptophan--tRNA ligase [Clostridiaceae bacterium]|nr:tryptophan--tRNA ligase [Clostridiaceae bacterium]
MASANTTVLTGIKPTGVPHIGNFLGAISPALRRAIDFEHAYFFIADYHALNSVDDPRSLRDLTYNVAATWLAAGLDPTKIHFYRQSDISEIFELETILNTVTPKGWMNKMHAYKAQSDRNKEANKSVDSNINMGLYTYPLLMASDILIFQSDTVPVGNDQVQHVEIARDIAQRFNKKYKTDALVLPQYVLEEGIEELPGIDGRKMSKSYGNTIPLFATRAEWEQSVRKIVTDSLTHTPETFRLTVLYKIFAAVASPESTERLVADFTEGTIGWKDAKDQLVEQLIERFGSASETYAKLMADKSQIDTILDKSSNEIRTKAQATLYAAKKAIGVR